MFLLVLACNGDQSDSAPGGGDDSGSLEPDVVAEALAKDRKSVV